MEPIHSLEEFRETVDKNMAILAYFSTPACSMCAVLKPKVDQMISENFPRIKTISISSDELPELAAQNCVFTAPTVLVFFQGKESIRKSRTFGIDVLKTEIQRSYAVLFE